MRNAIQESIMMANIDNRRRLDGKVPLDVTQPYKMLFEYKTIR